MNLNHCKELHCLFEKNENRQSLLPYRYEDISDFRADCLAIVLAGILTFVIDVAKMRKAS